MLQNTVAIIIYFNLSDGFKACHLSGKIKAADAGEKRQVRHRSTIPLTHPATFCAQAGSVA